MLFPMSVDNNLQPLVAISAHFHQFLYQINLISPFLIKLALQGTETSRYRSR